MFIDFYLWCQGTTIYRGAALHSLVCLCLVNDIFKCWGNKKNKWNTGNIALTLYVVCNLRTGVKWGSCEPHFRVLSLLPKEASKQKVCSGLIWLTCYRRPEGVEANVCIQSKPRFCTLSQSSHTSVC